MLYNKNKSLKNTMFKGYLICSYIPEKRLTSTTYEKQIIKLEIIKS